MPKFVFGYHGGSMAATPEAQEASMQAWGAWFGSLGEAVADGGAPFGATKTLAADGAVREGGGANPLTGYSIVTADSLDAAVALAKGCPILTDGGSVEVCEYIEM